MPFGQIYEFYSVYFNVIVLLLAVGGALIINLEELAEKIRNDGYSEVNAEARVCQDVVLKAISKSSLNRNVTIKAGVVMRNITGDARRATQDLDFDYIRYSLSEESIQSFIRKLNCIDGISISIDGEIEELSQQEYRGKRVFVIQHSLALTFPVFWWKSWPRKSTALTMKA